MILAGRKTEGRVGLRRRAREVGLRPVEAMRGKQARRELGTDRDTDEAQNRITNERTSEGEGSDPSLSFAGPLGELGDSGCRPPPAAWPLSQRRRPRGPKGAIFTPHRTAKHRSEVSWSRAGLLRGWLLCQLTGFETFPRTHPEKRNINAHCRV